MCVSYNLFHCHWHNMIILFNMTVCIKCHFVTVCFIRQIVAGHLVCWCSPLTCPFPCTAAGHMNTWSFMHACTFVCVRMSLSSGMGVLVAGWTDRSAREGGSLQLSLQLPTGCEGHWCDSTNYRGRKPALQTFTAAAAQLGSVELNPSSTSHFTLHNPPRWIAFQVPC